MDCPFYGVRALKASAQNDMDCGETVAAHLEAGWRAVTMSLPDPSGSVKKRLVPKPGVR